MSATAPALEISGLTKSFGTMRALDDVRLVVEAGTVHCVLGENGAGKSTLCHVVGGSLVPDKGVLRLYGTPYAPRRPADALAAGIAMVHQHFSLVPTLTVGENLRLLRLRDLPRRVARVREEYGLEPDLDARVSDLPVGVRQRVEIVKALLREPRLLVLDEPTGVLGPAETDALLATCRRIAAAGHAVVLVTHKLGEAARAGDAATVLRAGRVAGGGPLAELPPERLVPLMIGRPAASLDAGLAGTIGLTEDRPSPGAGASAGPGTGASPETGTSGAERRRGPGALRLSDVGVRRADGSYALDRTSLDVGFGEIVGIAGVEGNGQSELMALLGGALAPDTGRVELAGRDITRAAPRERTRAGLGVVPEDRHREGCVPQLPVAENLFLGRLDRFRRYGVFLDRRAMNHAADAVLTGHGIRSGGPGALMSSLSGGNQQKVVLARELALDPLVCLAAAQPTRGLDIGAVGAVHSRIRQASAKGTAVLVVSSELSELLVLCDRIVVAYRGKLLGPVDPSQPDARERIGALMLGADHPAGSGTEGAGRAAATAPRPVPGDAPRH
ncbi:MULTISPECIES: ABC transporter ATP-binding protein [Streptomyces]|uniref:Simple sugar transport system ATP-binding protein n=1 Tax=Streptomyces clavifer TaxID=68188 RepID=A0ABS4V4L6_9ACTN|nr:MULTISPECIES: ABC transporter ATP-binding protein [Streptomyces]MBP2358857.1 simple sugar transport system ATP-binding protein [Streptomyces clavifer]MDX2745536.1 ABC transporter ATP-binding protein [Streptomyces sp. NRRL_B-2557]MDX3065957.1 ABC transporter ATP-binding protein [Streptomyces sp. ND04-05B]GHA84230.1 sugar ABC transporter [Streptomyces clavifer]